MWKRKKFLIVLEDNKLADSDNENVHYLNARGRMASSRSPSRMYGSRMARGSSATW